MSQLIECISNADVVWEADFAGLAPTVTGGEARRILEADESPIADLLPALSDPEKFVAAHVLLTRLTRVDYESFPTWNGLAVDIAADGTATIPSGQCHTLARRWHRWHQTTPRPNQLPGDD